MKPTVTVTLNPCIDGASEVVRPTRKIRTTNERYYAGGGGIDVARVIAVLGGPVQAVYLNGGAIGPLLDHLLGEAGLAIHTVPTADTIRISHAVFERSTGLQYRFVAERPEVTAAARGARFVLDTSGPALAATLADAHVYFAKPSLGELQELVGHPIDTPAARDAAALDLLARVSMLVVTMGYKGALLAMPAA